MDGSTIPLACVSLLVRGNLSATHVVLLGYPNSYIKQKNFNAICILYKSPLHDHKEALCFLSGGFRRSPTNEEKKGQERGCEKILSLRMQIDTQLLVLTKLAPVPE